MDWTVIATTLVLASAGDAPRLDCAFPARIDLAYGVTGKRRLPVPGGKDGVCHLVKHDASLEVAGDRGTITVRETGKKPPRGAQLATCEERFRIVDADEPRAWHRCPGADDGAIHRVRIHPDRPGLPDGFLTVVLCGSKVAKVEVDLGLRWKPCAFDWQVDEPSPDFAACAEKLPPTTSHRSATGSQALACRE